MNLLVQEIVHHGLRGAARSAVFRDTEPVPNAIEVVYDHGSKPCDPNKHPKHEQNSLCWHVQSSFPGDY